MRMKHRRVSGLPQQSVLWAVSLLALCCLACEDETTGLGEEGFVAIITDAVGPLEVAEGAHWSVHVRELSGTIMEDTIVPMAPRDTVILTLPIATYIITLQGLPLPCTIRNPVQEAWVPQRGTTFTVRYRAQCSALLAIGTETVGPPTLRDEAMVWRIRQGTDQIRGGTIGANDTARVDGVDPGDYTVELTHVEDNCVITSPGGRRRNVTISPPRTTFVPFGLFCSDPAWRPRLLRFESRLRDGYNVIFFEATDPGSSGQRTAPDIARFRWDMTDCRGRSVRTEDPIWKTGLDLYHRTKGQDTVRVVTVFEVGELLPHEELCTSLFIIDGQGNSTRLVEDTLSAPVGRDPRVQGFRVVPSGPEEARYLEFELDASDPDGDLAGGYLHLTYQDGTFGQPDGIPEVVVPWVVGFLGTEVPLFDPRPYGIPLEGLQSATIFVIDRQGNFTRFTDSSPLN